MAMFGSEKTDTCWKDRPPGGKTLMMLINELAKLFHDRIKGECEKLGVPSSYRHILFILGREDGLNQLDLAKLTHLKAPTVSVTLQKMEAEGIVQRKADAADQRVTRIYLTDKGNRINDIVREKFMEAEKSILEEVSPGDETTVKDILGKIIDNELKRTSKK